VPRDLLGELRDIASGGQRYDSKAIGAQGFDHTKRVAPD
jgi:hypothetical protein